MPLQGLVSFFFEKVGLFFARPTSSILPSSFAQPCFWGQVRGLVSACLGAANSLARAAIHAAFWASCCPFSVGGSSVRSVSVGPSAFHIFFCARHGSFSLCKFSRCFFGQFSWSFSGRSVRSVSGSVRFRFSVWALLFHPHSVCLHNLILIVLFF